jgi:hypothetical protein
MFIRFLLPALQIQAVLEQPSISHRQQALKSMPQKLDDAFRETIDRIKRQAPNKATQAMEVLKWTYLAERHLTVIELRHAIATTSNSTAKSLNMNDLSFERSLTECCYGLVVIDQETWSVRLVTSRYKTSSKHRLNSLDASLRLGARDCWLCSNHSHRLASRP